jgi:membrane protein implicated in regulation of membrane protease activity
MAGIIAEIGPWLWMILGFALLAVEVLVPRGPALALGLGAILTGTLVIALQFSSTPIGAVWQQGVLFIGLALCTGAFQRRLFRQP